MKPHWKFHHMGLVVRDLKQTLDDYRSLGLLSNVSDCFASKGKSSKRLGYFIRVGTLNMEVSQSVPGNTVQQQGLSVVFGVKPPITPAGGAACRARPFKYSVRTL